MIGVSIPRKARSSSLKRTQECGGSGSGELIHRQASTSPARPSPSSNTAISPSSSNVSVRKKKPISGSKHRPPKISKSSIQEIEIEVAEVLYGMTRQAPAPPAPPSLSSRQDANGLTNEAKSRVSSPGSFSLVPATSQASVLPGPNLNSSNNNSAPLMTTAPKRKRPPLKLEDESPTSPVTKPEIELPPKLEEGSAAASPSRSEKKTAAAAVSPAVDNGDTDLTDAGTVAGGDHMQEPTKQESSSHVPEQKEAKEEIALTTTSKSKEVPCSMLNASLDEATVIEDGSAVPKAESPREEKFSIDLMAPPPPAPMGNSERDGSTDYAADHKPIEPVKELVQRPDAANGEMEKPDRSSKQQEAIEAASAENIGSSKHAAKEKPPMLDLQLDLEKQNKDGLSLGGGGSSNKHQQQMKQQPKAPTRIDPKQEKKAQSVASLPLTMPIAGWPGGFPHFGYMGQVPTLPAVMPMDGSSAAAKTLQAPHFFPPQKPKRCATHCYIAQTIHYNQQIARMNPFWPPAAAAAAAAAAVGTSPIYGAKQHNLNLVPPSEAAILGNPLQGSFPGRSLGPLQDKAPPAVAMTFTGPPAKEKSSAAAAAANSTLIEAQRKQFLLQQTPQPGSSTAPPNMLHGPAFIFPISQQPTAAAAAVAAAATRSITAKSTPGIGNAAPSAASGSPAAAGSGPSGHSTTTMSFNYPGLQPNDTQYLAFLQNNGYPFPIPAHVGGGPSPYRGASPSQAMPFFNGSFYSSPMLHPPSQQQFRQQQQQPPPTHQQPPAHSQQGHQNTSTSSGSSSSQKHHSQRLPGGAAAAAGATPAGGSSHNFSAKQHLHLLPPQARQLESEAGCEDSPSTADSSRVSQAQKSIYGNFAMSIHPQNFALISPAAVPSSGGGGGGGHNEKPQPVHNQANLTPSQAYAMSFAPFGGPAAAAAVAAAGGAQGLDFSSMVQNHALFHSLPEAARHHGYQQITAAAAAAAAAQAAQHKKSRHEDGKSVGDPGAAGANVACEEGKMMASTGKSPGGVAQHSLSFSRPDNNDPQASAILGNSSNVTEGSSRTLNLIQPPANGGRASNRPSSAAPASNSPVANTATASNLHMQSSQQQQQHMIQLQKSQQHQQQLHLQQQMSSRPAKGSSHGSNNATIYSDRMPAGSMSRFSQGALAGLPPSIIQSATAAQSPQWKASGRAATSGPANSATSSSSSAKNQVPQQQQQQQQQQARNQQQHQQTLLGSNMHQTQISFGMSSSKAVGVSGQTHLAGGSGNSPLASAAGSPQSAVSKSSAGNGGGGNGSPRASSTSKSGPPPPTLLSPALPVHQQTPAGKNSPSSSSSNLKSSSPANNRNMTSILGHPQITPASNSSSNTKFQQQSQQQQQQKQSFHQPQLFFSSPYLQAAQSSQPNVAAAAANFYQQQRRQSEQHAHQHSQQSQQQNSTNSGVLSLCPSSLTLAGSSPTSDPAKAASAAAAGVMKGLAPTPGAAGGGILQHNAQYAASSMGQHPLMSSSFPYIQTMSSSVSVKPAGDQKAAPGSENLHWKPEKR
ncbi:protein TIME FOR COFFEE-like [Iris pallida]|uniref:Protein TIME FOR COFFEE-like n=1 Tax=Iris pallida TaxID=29817 RepID=A0AAX6HGK2_IRIPA|nr:protein TIME FOR COFFEE-like [Iris pallida]